MKTVLHKANTRGHANHGWLDTYHTFSFADYYHSERMHFGVLRVLNDDTVGAGQGFGMHPHNNMEIISIPLEGDLEHKDSMGNVAVIKAGEIQVMSAGTGILHAEYNPNKNKEVHLLQIWVHPNKQDVEPRYDQISIEDIEANQCFKQILSPHADDAGLWIHQDAWFYMASFDEDGVETYRFNKQGNGLYLFVLEGEVDINDLKLEKRDGIGIWNVNQFDFKAGAKTKVLLMEVPMLDL